LKENGVPPPHSSKQGDAGGGRGLLGRKEESFEKNKEIGKKKGPMSKGGKRLSKVCFKKEGITQISRREGSSTANVDKKVFICQKKGKRRGFRENKRKKWGVRKTQARRVQGEEPLRGERNGGPFQGGVMRRKRN